MLEPHPWRRLSILPHVTLKWHEGGPMGWCCHSRQEVSLRLDMTQSERRCTLAHELFHLSHGPAVKGFEAADERLVRDETARWLIPFDELAKALTWCSDDEEVADMLWVDIRTVQDRLVNLTAVESEELNRRLDRAELSFPKF